mgnify:CR=1 FL=1
MVERRCQSNQERMRQGDCDNKHELIVNSIPLLNDRRGAAASKDNPSTSKTNVIVIKHACLPRRYSAHGLLALDDKITVRKDLRDTAWVRFLYVRWKCDSKRFGSATRTGWGNRRRSGSTSRECAAAFLPESTPYPLHRPSSQPRQPSPQSANSCTTPHPIPHTPPTRCSSFSSRTHSTSPVGWAIAIPVQWCKRGDRRVYR